MTRRICIATTRAHLRRPGSFVASWGALARRMGHQVMWRVVDGALPPGHDGYDGARVDLALILDALAPKADRVVVVDDGRDGVVQRAGLSAGAVLACPDPARLAALGTGVHPLCPAVPVWAWRRPAEMLHRHGPASLVQPPEAPVRVPGHNILPLRAGDPDPVTGVVPLPEGAQACGPLAVPDLGLQLAALATGLPLILTGAVQPAWAEAALYAGEAAEAARHLERHARYPSDCLDQIAQGMAHLDRHFPPEKAVADLEALLRL